MAVPIIIAMAAISMISSIQGQAAAAREADRKRSAEIAGAKTGFLATQSSVNIMKRANRESSFNAINEALRAGAEQDRIVKAEIEVAGSKLKASSEGLTSGRSVGRQAVSLYVQGNKAVQQSKSQTASVINQITDQQDSMTNELNNRLLTSYQQMTAVLTTPGNIYQGNNGEVLSAGVQGASSGVSLSSAIK